MKKKYILTNIPSYIINDNHLGLKELGSSDVLETFAGNSGNCMFWEAAKRIITKQTNVKLLSLKYFKKNIEFYKDKIETVVLTTANMIGGEKNFPKTRTEILQDNYNVLSRIDCKKYMFSIGAQSFSLGMFEFSKEKKDLYMKYFSIFDYVNLRGQYTYDLLKHNGIPLDNCEVVGCPSILLKPIDIGELNSKFEKLKKQTVNKVKVGINFPASTRLSKLAKRFFSIMDDPDVYTLAVDKTDMYEFVNEYGSFPTECDNRKDIEKNRKNFIFSGNVFESIEFFRNNVDLMIGTRIHGTILGLCAGLPSMCVVIDSRTYELCEQLSIPYINCIEKSIEFYTKEELLKIFIDNFDISKLDGLGEIIKKNTEKYKIW